MYQYLLYGFKVQSEIAIEEAVRCSIDSPDVVIEKKVVSDNTLLDIHNNYIKFYKDRIIFCVGGAGIYDISDGNKITVTVDLKNSSERTKIFLLGSAFGILFIQRGDLAIHGSCVAVNQKGTIITGVSGAGKSTLGADIYRKGAYFVSDDVCRVKSNQIPSVVMSYPQQKLCGDAIKRFGYSPTEFRMVDPECDKYAISDQRIIRSKAEVPLVNMIELSINNESHQIQISEIRGEEKIHLIMNNIYRGVFYNRLQMSNEVIREVFKIANAIKGYRIQRPAGRECLSEISDAVMELIK